ncbi:MAG: hypothetical protein PHY47_27375 [Lachnospiraceae bacterium]|nr:hypothetical protein [Lachnospiraceae bacterium]
MECSNEICEINYILQGLYDERIYGFNGNQSRSDGTIQTNVNKLIDYLNKVVYKIDDEREWAKEKIFKIVKEK